MRRECGVCFGIAYIGDLAVSHRFMSLDWRGYWTVLNKSTSCLVCRRGDMDVGLTKRKGNLQAAGHSRIEQGELEPNSAHQLAATHLQDSGLTLPSLVDSSLTNSQIHQPVYTARLKLLPFTSKIITKRKSDAAAWRLWMYSQSKSLNKFAVEVMTSQ